MATIYVGGPINSFIPYFITSIKYGNTYKVNYLVYSRNISRQTNLANLLQYYHAVHILYTAVYSRKCGTYTAAGNAVL